MSEAETEALMAVVIVTLLFIFIIAVFGSNGNGGAINGALYGFKMWFQNSRISM